MRCAKSQRNAFGKTKLHNFTICMEDLRNACKVLVGKPEGKRPLTRPRRRWEENIRMDLSEVRWEGVDWMHLAQSRDQWRAVVNTIMNIRVP
jgi:hypothetical protein